MKRTIFRVTFDDNETKSVSAQPLEPRKYIAAVSLTKPDKFEGDYGIDWCDMSEDFSNIEKFQGSKISDISHVFDETTSQFKAGGTALEKQALVKKMYQDETYHEKDYPLTWINLPKDKVAELTITPFLMPDAKVKATDFLTLIKSPDFEITYDGKTDANESIKLENPKKPFKIQVKALKTYTTTKYISIKDHEENEVGKIEMAANNIVNLNIKIIPIVFNASSKASDAEALHEKALKAKDDKNNNLKTTLNTKSLNQAGINCTITPFNKANPEYVFIDPSVGDWTNYYNSSTNILSDWTFKPTDANKPKQDNNEDGIKSPANRTTKLLLDELKQAYFSKPDRKNFKGAIIFVSDKSFSKATISGYSENIPLKNQGTVIFKTGLEKSKTYAHELAHMLGLEHSFLDDDINSQIANRITQQNTIDKEAEKKYILRQKGHIKVIQKEFSKDKQNALKENRSIDNDVMNKYNKNLKRVNENIKISEDNIKTYDLLSRQINIGKGNGFKMIQKSSKNFMDYYNKKVYFNRFQSEIMKQECIDYYQ